MESKGEVAPRKSKERTRNNASSDAILVGTTLSIYKFLVKSNKPASAREVQRFFDIKSPSSAQFHLDKLERNGFIVKSQLNDGKYLIDKLFLNHYFKFKKFLLPRYLLYAFLSTSFTVGWAGSLLFGSLSLSPQTLFFLIYGLGTTLILTGIYWIETFRSAKNDRI